MRLPTLKRHRDAELPGVSGTARLDRRTKSLIRRLKPGDIAVIDHVDLDRASAEALVGAGVAAVVNVAPSISGRYPNLGPQVLVDADVPLYDAEGAVFTQLRDGDRVRIDSEILWRGEEGVGEVTSLGAEEVALALESARSGMAAQLEAFSVNAMEFIRRERELLLDGVGLPATRTQLEGRPVVVVMKNHNYEADLKRLKRFIREADPVLVGVDAGAEVLLAAGHTPHIALGDVETMSDSALRCGAEVIVRAPRDGRPWGTDRLERLGVSCQIFRTSSSSEDAALLLADTLGAHLVVTVGSHASLEEFLDKGRSSMASTFLSRLRVGPSLVDAQVVHQLYQSRIRTWQLLLTALIGLLAVALAVAATPVGEGWMQELRDAIEELWSTARGWFA